MLKHTGDWLKNHHRQIADLAPKILKVALALAGVFSAIKLVNIATSLTTSILGLVATPVGQVMLAVGAVAAAIAGLVAALIYAYHHCREFHDRGTRWSTASCRPGVGRSGSSRCGCRRRRWRGRRSASPPLHPSLHRTLNPHHVEENDMQFIQAAHHSADPNLPPTRVVIHATCPDVGFPSASRAGRAVGTAGYLASISASGSAHYVCDVTETVQCLGEDVIGWLAPPNGHSIGIEICADGGSRASFNNPSHAYSPEQWLSPQVWLAVEKAAHLTQQICHRYAIPVRRLTVADLKAGQRGICGHADVSAAWHQSDHDDPGPWFSWDQFIAAVRAGAERKVDNIPHTLLTSIHWGEAKHNLGGAADQDVGGPVMPRRQLEARS